jgi:hypothetical protein
MFPDRILSQHVTVLQDIVLHLHMTRYTSYDNFSANEYIRSFPVILSDKKSMHWYLPMLALASTSKGSPPGVKAPTTPPEIRTDIQINMYTDYHLSFSIRVNLSDQPGEQLWNEYSQNVLKTLNWEVFLIKFSALTSVNRWNRFAEHSMTRFDKCRNHHSFP